MKRPSPRGSRFFVAAAVVGATAVLAVLPAAAGAARPATDLATASAPAVATASAAVFPPGGISVPLDGGVIKQPEPPLFPGLYTIQAMPLAVTIGWFDRSKDEQKFVLYRRDL